MAPPAERAGSRRGGPAGVPKDIPRRLTNPANPVARLYRATPDERERALEKLPPAQQERFRQNLQWFDGLPKPQQEFVLKQVDRFSALSPAEQKEVGENLRALNQLPAGRRTAVRTALRKLRGMSEPERQAAMENERFQNRFSPDEQRIIQHLSEVMTPGQ